MWDGENTVSFPLAFTMIFEEFPLCFPSHPVTHYQATTPKSGLCPEKVYVAETVWASLEPDEAVERF